MIVRRMDYQQKVCTCNKKLTTKDVRSLGITILDRKRILWLCCKRCESSLIIFREEKCIPPRQEIKLLGH